MERDEAIEKLRQHEAELKELGLFQLTDVKERASSILGRKVDIMTRDSLPRRTGR